MKVKSNKDEMFKNACRVALSYYIHRYLICNTTGRQDGVEKASTHRELCNFYVAVKHGLADSDDVNFYSDECSDDFDLVHEATQELTSYMDREIGFPINSKPDYDKLVLLFFEKFHSLATKSLKIG